MTSLIQVRQQPAGGRPEDYAAIVTDEITAALLEPAWQAASHLDHNVSTAALIRYRNARRRPA